MTEPRDSNSPEHFAQPAMRRPETAGRVIASSELFGVDREVLIEHQGSFYRLRLTRSGKLILHK